MKNIFEIEDNINSIISEIEENGGEVTEEQLQALEIGEQELKEKLSSYRKVCAKIDADIESCKCEEKRLKSIRDTRDNIKTKLKGIMLDAVLKYGYNGKSGNKVYDLPDSKLFTKKSSSVTIDETRTDLFIMCLHAFCQTQKCTNHLKRINILTIEEILAEINDNGATYFGLKEEEYFTFSDFISIKLNISGNYSLKDIFFGENTFIGRELNELPLTHEIKVNMNKTLLSSMLDTMDITYATKNYKDSLNIK